MAEKRKLKRGVRRCETEFTSDGVSNRGIASNFTADGLFLRTSRPVPPESTIDLKVYLPDGKVARLRGKVRWAAKPPKGRVFQAAARSASAKNGMGIEIQEKDGDYDLFVKSLQE